MFANTSPPLLELEESTSTSCENTVVIHKKAILLKRITLNYINVPIGTALEAYGFDSDAGYRMLSAAFGDGSSSRSALPVGFAYHWLPCAAHVCPLSLLHRQTEHLRPNWTDGGYFLSAVVISGFDLF